MPYVIRKTNGTNLLTIQDGIVDNSTALSLIGRSYTNYGELLADNFVRLMENFSNDTAPPNPIQGQIWYDSSTADFRYWYIDPVTNNGSWSVMAKIGYTGSAGYTGSTGTIGSTGYTGSEGVGYTGSQGSSGYDGSIGSVGYDGSQGAIGYTGSQGSTGYDGSIGSVGYTGSEGAGYTGSKGNTGYAGSTGYTGSQGLPGLSALGNLTVTNQTITGGILNQDIVIDPLGIGKIKFVGDIIPDQDRAHSIGNSGANYSTLYVTRVRFNDGTTIDTAKALSGATPPTSSMGSAGDKQGWIAFDNNYMYYCKADFNGFSPIWTRVAWAGTW